MRALGPREMLEIWERGESAGTAQRALALIAQSEGASLFDTASLGIGMRNSRLLALREAMFGRRIEASAACPACGERMEFAFETADMRADAAPSDALVAVAHGGWHLTLRVPCGADLIDLPRSVDTARETLFQKCLVCVDGAAAPAQWPVEVLETAAAAIAARDPQAHMELDLACAACAHRFVVPFSIAQFLWNEISHAGRRLIEEVTALARAFGWSEAESLALSPARRRKYLEAAQA